MIASIYSLSLVIFIISVASLMFLRTRLLYESNYISITEVTARAQRNFSCVLGMKILDSGDFLWLNHPFGGLS